MNKPFTYEQAEEICEDFEDLVDTELVIEGVQHYIDHVIMVPYPTADKALFIQSYREAGNILPALDSYSGDQYDVIIIASKMQDSNDITTIDIRKYIGDNGVGYNFPD
ncbi:MAG: hypothetical protein JST70_08035 [Bacteroidetes bacterium]|nr:hypothetical protein [Bacteroidota bacterium]